MKKIRWTQEEIDKIIELNERGVSSLDMADALDGRHSASGIRNKFSELGIPMKNKHRFSHPKTRRTDKQQHTTVDENPAPDAEPETGAGSTEKQGVAQSHDAIVTVANGDKLKQEDLLEAHGFDAKKWQIVTARNSVWEQQPEVTLYSSKISVKPRTDVDVDDLINDLNKKVVPIHVNQLRTGSRNLIITLFDVHMGWETYDHLKPYLMQIEEIIQRGFHQIDIIVGGDYFHSDFLDKTMTTSGTQLDHADNVKALDEGTRVFSELIETALTYSDHVAVHAIPGNHDTNKQYLWIYAMMQKYPDVEIHNTMQRRDCFMTGNVGVMIAHGDLALKRLPMLFASEYPSIWAKASHRVIFSGHFHTEKVNDDNGVVLHQCGTAKPVDNYEDRNGFTLSRKHMQLFEYDTNRLKATYEIEA